ncbi:MAG TPA: dihydrolipoamide acetyltransferase family protein [Symbiobacteriaceae bacterium]|jgi:pyruvate dehydrogenase E2 component (dihydrolipoamide acetyltransferase)
MAFEVAMPQMGVTMEAGTILKWLKQVGDSVEKDEPIMEIQTDKVSLEITSDATGTLLAIVVPVGKEVPVGTTLAYIGVAGEAAPAETQPAPGGARLAPQLLTPLNVAAQAPAFASAELVGGKVRATPAARARAKAYGVGLEVVRGSGPSGRIQARDVEAARTAPVAAPVAAAVAIAAAGPAPAAVPGAMPGMASRDVAVTGMRKVIATRMAQSFHSAVPVLLTAEADMDRADDLLARLDTDLKRKTPARVGYLPLVVKAVAAALVAHPRVNAHWLGEVIRMFESVNVGVAVSLEDGLAVPVLRNADQLGLAGIATGVAELAAKARAGGLALADLEGGTFTVSNLGGSQIGFFMPVINPPQVAILGLGRAIQKPVVRDGQVVIRPMLPLSLVFDHRAIDGAPAAAFLDDVRAALEEPCRLLV